MSSLGLRINTRHEYIRYKEIGQYRPSTIGWGPIVNNGIEYAIIGTRIHGIGPLLAAKTNTG